MIFYPTAGGSSRSIWNSCQSFEDFAATSPYPVKMGLRSPWLGGDTCAFNMCIVDLDDEDDVTSLDHLSPRPR